MDERVLSGIGERLRRQLPAGVAIDARGIDKELAVRVVGQSFLRVSHALPFPFVNCALSPKAWTNTSPSSVYRTVRFPTIDSFLHLSAPVELGKRSFLP
jgi:hypothetical protein